MSAFKASLTPHHAGVDIENRLANCMAMVNNMVTDGFTAITRPPFELSSENFVDSINSADARRAVSLAETQRMLHDEIAELARQAMALESMAADLKHREEQVTERGRR